ncbi:MAG: efflux RND transporter periplasmic adaptor subunit [Janthinobacterium lividum]
MSVSFSAPKRPWAVRMFQIAIAVVIVLGGLWFSFGRGKTQVATVATAAPVPVAIQAARVENLPIWISAIAHVQALNTVDVKVRSDGQLQKIFFQEGQLVKAGDLLAQIDPRVYQAQVEQAQALVARDAAQVVNLQVSLKRATALAEAKAGPTQDVDTFTAQLAAQRATVLADKAALDNAKLQLGFTQVRAPLTGRTGQRLLDEGAIVHAADLTGLVSITQMNPISVIFPVSQDVISQILAENGRSRLKVKAVSRDGTQTIATGELSFIDSQVVAATGQIQLKAQFDNSGNQLWPGELIGARLLLRTQADAVVVPDTAVELGAKGDFVYVVDASGRAQPRHVDAANVVAGQQWIRSGLTPGEKVVVSGQYRIAPGVAVSNVGPGAAEASIGTNTGGTASVNTTVAAGAAKP